MNQNQEESLVRLLRLKRHEQPPHGYHEKFLRNFHRRQRAEALKSGTWQSLWEAFCGIWPNYQVPRLAYAACVAALAGAGVFLIVQPHNPRDTAQGTLAQWSTTPNFSLEPQHTVSAAPVTIGATIPVSSPAGTSEHYVLQPSPSSTDQPLSF